MSLPSFLEARCLKRPKLGRADVYPQHPKQKEDELTSVNVKQGFNNPPPFNDEYSSAHLYSVDSNKIGSSFSSMLTQKQVINTFKDKDAGKRRPQVTKDNFHLIPVINPKTRSHLQSWLKELSAPKPLSQLCKRVPVLNKKDDIFQSLADYEIPLVRAAWYIKMTAAFSLTQTDAKMKKRAASDPNSDWTQAICKFLREQLNKLNEDNHLRSEDGSLPTYLNATVGSVGVGSVIYSGSNPTTTILRDDLEKQLQYMSNLAHHMYTEGLLDRQEFLSWLVDEFECVPFCDDVALSYFIPFILQYVEEVVANQPLARKISFAAARHLNWIFQEGASSRSESPALTSGRTTPGCSSSNGAFRTQEQLRQQCTLRLQSMAYTLACSIQCTAISCPGALVWYPPTDPKSPGSPLDLLPCPPSALPLPEIPKDDATALQQDVQARKYVAEKEKEIVHRSLAAEMHWSSDKCQESTAGYTINRVLGALEALDKQSFDRIGFPDALYHKIFDHLHGKEDDNIQIPRAGEEAVIGMLCEWATSTERLGEHRASVVAKLLDMRQSHYEQEASEQPETSASQSNPASAASQPEPETDQSAPTDKPAQPTPKPRSTPYFQDLLFTFLDTQAPSLQNPNDAEELRSFRNLVMLFSELVEHDVFAHDQYINTLVSRGDVSPGQLSTLPTYTATPQNDNQPGKFSDVQSVETNLDESLTASRGLHDMKGAKGDVDFASASESVFSPDSRHDRHFLDAVRPVEQNNSKQQPGMASNSMGSGPGKARKGPIWGYDQPRHVQYIMHFQLPFQSDDLTYEWNQRLMVLYGAGKQKSGVKRVVKKITRHLTKLIQNKRSLDGKQDENQAAYWSGSSKKGKNSGKSHEELLSSYRALAYFDQHLVTSNVAKALVNAFNAYVSGRSKTLPSLEVIILIFDLMEEALNIGGLVQTATSMTSCLANLSLIIKRKQKETVGSSSIAKQNYMRYMSKLSLATLSILRHYQSYLTVNTDLALEAFEGFLAVARQSSLSNPTNCTATERSILIFLNDIFTASIPYMKSKYPEFSSYYAPVRQAIASVKKPATSNCRYEPTFLRQYIENPGMESALSVAERFGERLSDTRLRYSFVCTAIKTVCSGQQTVENVNALAGLCAEMNARCTELSAEWLGVLKTLCLTQCTSNFNDVLIAVETGNPRIRDPLAIFTAVLIARGAIHLEDVLQHVAIPCLLSACSNKTQSSNDPDTGARLTTHLLLQLFKTPTLQNSSSSSKQSFSLPSSSDRHLLAAAQRNIADGAVLAVLKAVLKIGDVGSSERKGMYGHDSDVSVTSFLAPIHDDFDDLDIEMENPSIPQHSGKDEDSWIYSPSLSEFAKRAVRVICAQQWVRDRCLNYPNMDLLMDQVLTKEQRQNLIQIICSPEGDLKKLSVLSKDLQKYVASILRVMTRWTLRQCLLELQVMLHESQQDKTLPEHIAKATIEVFQEQQLQQSMEPMREQRAVTGPELDRTSVWLIAPLISKLPSQVQGRVLQEASVILEAPPNWASTRGGSGGRGERHERNYGGSSLLNHQPFLTLILTCLKVQDDQRESLLESLQSQLIMLHSQWRDAGKDVPNFTSSQNGLHDALQLRLSLVGGMFDTVQSNSQWTSEVVVLLTQLITSGMVDIQVNKELFNIVYDMIAVLLHHTLGGDVPNRAEGSKRDYLNIVKKMKKEIGDHQSESISQLRQLLPIQRSDLYLVCCEPVGPLMDIKGNKIPVPVDGNSGLQATSKQKISVWEIIEGLKNPSPLCFAWFGARKMERKKLYYENEHELLLYHQHGNKSSLDEFLKPPDLPPEEDEVLPPPPKIPDLKPSIKVTSGASSSVPTTPGSDARRAISKREVKTKKRISVSRQPKMETTPALHRGHGSFSAMPGANQPGGMMKAYLQQPPQTGNFRMGSHNPPPYQQYPLQNPMNTAPNTNPYQTQGGFPAPNQPPHVPPSTGRRESKQVLGQMLRNRITAQRTTQENPAMNPYQSSPVRQKLAEGVKSQTLMGGHEMFGQSQPRPSGLTQTHIMTQQTNQGYGNYTMQQKPPAAMIQNYNPNVYRTNATGGQMGYQQTTVGGQPNQQFIGGQQPMRTGNYGVQQSSNYGNQPQSMMGIQRTNQQFINQHPGSTQQMTRINTGSQQMGSGLHQMNPTQGIPQNPQMNQRQMMDQHPQMMNAPRQYGQQMQSQQPNTMIEMRLNMLQQQQQQQPPSQY